MQTNTQVFKITRPDIERNRDKYVVTDDFVNNASYSRYNSFSNLLRSSSTRLSKYITADQMAIDPDVNKILSTFADDICTEGDDGSIFTIHYKSTGAEMVVPGTAEILQNALNLWIDAIELKANMYDIAMQTIKYGDCFFRKVSDFKKWIYINPYDVQAIEVDDESNIVAYHVMRQADDTPYDRAGVNQKGSSIRYPAETIVHISLSSHMNQEAPFGESITVPATKYYRYLTMIESAIVIYRLVRAPERRVFNIDVGDMPIPKVKSYIRNIQQELYQRRSTSNQNNSQNSIDSIYDAMSTGEDFFFPKFTDGRGTTIDTLPGGQNLGQLEDLNYFRYKVCDGFGAPTAIIKSGSDGNSAVNNGKVGVALLEEKRYTNKIIRLQRKMEHPFDKQFKVFLRESNIDVDESSFELQLNSPADYENYRKIELQTSTISLFSQLKDVPYLSKRFLMENILQFSKDAIAQNELMIKEELGLANRKAETFTTNQLIYDEHCAAARQIKLPEYDTFNMAVGETDQTVTNSGEDFGNIDSGADSGFGDIPTNGNDESETSTEEPEDTLAGEEANTLPTELPTNEPAEVVQPMDFSSLSAESHKSRNIFNLLQEFNTKS